MSSDDYMAFDPSEWERLDIDFPGENPSKWRLLNKICEKITTFPQDEYKMDNAPSSAWAVFNCIDDKGVDGVMKIYMQYVYLLV